MGIHTVHLYAILGWIIWCTLHSFLISMPVKEYMKRRLRDRFRFYRLFYGAFSLATLTPLVLYCVSIRQGPIFRWKGTLTVIAYLLLVAGVGLFCIGGRNYSLFRFLGITQIRKGESNGSLSGYNSFVVSGIHRIIRHPWYLGGIVIVWAEDLSPSAVLINLVISSYFVIGTFLEEGKMVREFGDRYREYQRNVSMFFPYKWLKARITGKVRFHCE